MNEKIKLKEKDIKKSEYIFEVPEEKVVEEKYTRADLEYRIEKLERQLVDYARLQAQLDDLKSMLALMD